jgi:hypothetical protein
VFDYGSSLLIMLTVVLIVVFSHCISYYDNRIDKLSMVIWLMGEGRIGLNVNKSIECTIDVSYIVIVELLTQL